MTYDEAIRRLREVLARIGHDSPDQLFRTAAQIRDAKQEVIDRYTLMFSSGNLDNLTTEQFQDFLRSKNNQHWDLQRRGTLMIADMKALQNALSLLVDESVPIRDRLDQLRPPNGDPMVKGLGRAVITAILQVVYSDKYGVFNSTAEKGMKELGVWPEMRRGATFGERYELINRVFLNMAEGLGVDLWTLDMLWWRLVNLKAKEPAGVEEKDKTVAVTAIEVGDDEAGVFTEGVFGLERYLHEFLVDNWSSLELGQKWDLLEEDGEIVGSHYDTGVVGEIDLLAKHQTENRWLVVELKRDQSSDTTVGQILRYMTWVRRHLAKDADEVEGIIISRMVDEKLKYALDGQPLIRCMTYQVSFGLNPVPELQ